MTLRLCCHHPQLVLVLPLPLLLQTIAALAYLATALQVLPSSALSFYTYESAKQLLQVQE